MCVGHSLNSSPKPQILSAKFYTQSLLCSSFLVVYYSPLPKNDNKHKKEISARRPCVVEFPNHMGFRVALGFRLWGLGFRV